MLILRLRLYQLTIPVVWSLTLSEQSYVQCEQFTHSLVLACVCMNTHMHCLYTREYMTVCEEFTLQFSLLINYLCISQLCYIRY